MSFINSIIKIFVGDKSEKDVKSLQPYLNKIKTFESNLSSLSNDELRARTIFFKEKIKEERAALDTKIATLKAEVEGIEDIDKREDIYTEIDALEKEAYAVSEKTLMEILPEAFAVVKEAARRFTENESLTATATDMDRDLSVKKEYVSIQGDQAVFQTTHNV